VIHAVQCLNRDRCPAAQFGRSALPRQGPMRRFQS
jgi:hypothetical protein